MITLISYLPNATSTSAPAQEQAGGGSQNVLTTPQSKEASAVVQLSAFGQVKSSLADLQNAATALKALNRPPNFSDFQAVVQSFVQSYNSLNKSVSDATVKQAALASDHRSKQALNEIRKATLGSNQSSVAAMQGLGVVQQANGTLAINQPQLERKFQDNGSSAVATLVDLSNRVSITTNTQLSDNWVIGKAENDLSARVGSFGNPHSAVPSNLETPKPPQQSVPVQSATGSAVRNAVTTYAGVAAL